MRRIYFILGPEVYVVKGAKRGALYNLADGHVYSVDEIGVQIISMCENGLKLTEILQKLNHLNAKELMDFLEFVGLKKMGSFSETFMAPNKIPYQDNNNGILTFAWLEITGRCNLRCKHCYMEASNKSRSKDSILLDWKQVMSELADLGCNAIQFIGGEPLLFDDLRDLIRFGKSLNLYMEVFTNATLITDFWVNLFQKYGVVVKTTVYSKNEMVHDQITGTPGSFNKTILNIQELKRNGVRVQLFTVMMRQNENYLKETLAFFKELGEDNPLSHCDVVRCSGRGANKDITPQKLRNWQYRNKCGFLTITKSDFFRRQKQHCCLSGKFCIQHDGEVIPCIMGREVSYGNVCSQPLFKIIQNDALKDLWATSRDRIAICNACEYRYACFGCILDIEKYNNQCGSQDGFIWRRNNRCLYDPYKGEWMPLSQSYE